MKKAIKKDLVKELKKDKAFTEKRLKNKEITLEKVIELHKKYYLEWKMTGFKAKTFLRKYYNSEYIKKKTFESYRNQVEKWIENFFRRYIRDLESRLRQKEKEEE
jgi:hypothetical protein